MDLVPKDQTTQIGLLLGSALLGILVLKNFEKQLSSNVSNGLVALVIVGTLYLAMDIHNQSQEGFYQDVVESNSDDVPGMLLNQTTAAANVAQDAANQANEAANQVNQAVKEMNNLKAQVRKEARNASANNAAANNAAANNAAANNAAANNAAANNAAANNAAANNAAANNAAANNAAANNAAGNNAGVPDNNDPDASEFANVEGLAAPAPVPNECYPKDILAPEELLPKDIQSQFAENTPNAPGALGDQNFLNAGFHLGVNTVGQSLRNANRQLRSEPPNPQVKVSPWLQSTIEPDVNRRPLEIASAQL